MPFASSINLVADGVIASKTGHDFGVLVAGAIGDINGDGFPEVASGNPWASFGFPDYGCGITFVLMGDGDGFEAFVEGVYVYGSVGFRLYGSGYHSASGVTLESAGDVNGDGFQDFLVGAPGFGNSPYGYGPFGQPNPPPTGAAYLVFGGPGYPSDTFVGYSGFGDGYVEVRGDFYDSAGPATGIGDFNGDGWLDFVVGAPGASGGAGKAYIVFGAATLPDHITSGYVDGTGGMTVLGAGYAGGSVSAAGDLNGDGLADLLIGASGADYGGSEAGALYVVFGRNDGLASLATVGLDGTNGFRIDGATGGAGLARTVAGGRDINGDGIADMVIGSRNGAYVVFGSMSSYPSHFAVGSLNGANGFSITSSSGASDHFGYSVELADINGDGYADVVVGAEYADTAGRTDNGAVYVVYGGPAGFAASFDIAGLDGVNGFRIDGAINNARAGRSIATSQDLNGDHIEDLLIVAESLNFILYGQQGSATQTGAAGPDLLQGGSGMDSLLGWAGNDILHGGAGADLLDGGDDNDKLFGESGDDTLDGGVGADRLNGGDGADILIGGSDNDYLDGGSGADQMIGGSGADIYIVDDTGDVTIELADEGYDIVRTELTWTLADNIEGLQLQGAAAVGGTGNALANNIQGNSGSNLLSGGGGTDTINGNDGDDTIVGGSGNDLLRGGQGADVFRVLQESVGTAVLETDTVYDFSTADGDIIDLSAIDAITGGADDAFSLVSAFTRHAGEMTLTLIGGQTVLRLDVNGDGKVDYQMKINGDVTGDSGGWMF